MRRRTVLFALASPAIGAARAQAQARPFRIGWLDAGAADNIFVNAFRRGLRDLGYTEGRTIIITNRWADGNLQRLPALAEELVRFDPDAIVTRGDAATIAARNATRTIPIVFHASDPVEKGLVASLAHPGGNLTGNSSLVWDLLPKRLALLKQTIPGLTRVAALVNLAQLKAAAQRSGDRVRLVESDPATPLLPSPRFEQEARNLGITLLFVVLRDDSALPDGFAMLSPTGIGAVMVPGAPNLYDVRARIVELARSHHVPLEADTSDYVRAGALRSYGTDYPEMYRKLAAYVDRILKGAKPADLPIEQPTKFELAVNLRTAQALGVTVPPAILQLADELIE